MRAQAPAPADATTELLILHERTASLREALSEVKKDPAVFTAMELHALVAELKKTTEDMQKVAEEREAAEKEEKKSWGPPDPIALRLAAMQGDASIVRRQLAAGVDFQKPDEDDGKTPLYWAAHGGHIRIVKLLRTAIRAAAEAAAADGRIEASPYKPPKPPTPPQQAEEAPPPEPPVVPDPPPPEPEPPAQEEEPAQEEAAVEEPEPPAQEEEPAQEEPAAEEEGGGGEGEAAAE